MRRVLVTGGGTGIGLAIARAFAAAGEGVTISGRREAPLRAAAAAGGFDWITADVTCEDDMPRLFARPFDVVVANAGSGQPAKIADLTLAQWNATLAVNLTGTFLTFRAALAGMPAGGRLIALASTASLQGGAAIPAYAAAKHGVLGLVRSVAQDVARRGITCNAICPGFVDTDMAHLGARKKPVVVLHPCLERAGGPDEPGAPKGIRIGIVGKGSGCPAQHAVQQGTIAGPVGLDRVAAETFLVEKPFTSLRFYRVVFIGNGGGGETGDEGEG